ncbi:hypothetical protein SSX86_000019 [Deinandra increscens subsp. villosa]|uniref:SWIM-type domain-containing protein n=1 Tax=Deinandra increscens subsp. villosa TaxID=3103831 RepID=A0AAP0HDR2_9ASTR
MANPNIKRSSTVLPEPFNRLSILPDEVQDVYGGSSVQLLTYQLDDSDFDPFFGEHVDVNLNVENEGVEVEVNVENEDMQDEDEELQDKFSVENGDQANESDDSDYIPNDVYDVDDIDVDMRDYRVHIDEGVEDNNQQLEVGDDDHEVEMDNELFDSGRENINNSIFYVGQSFGSKKEVKELINEISVVNRRLIRVVKDERKRLRAVCWGDVLTTVAKVKNSDASSSMGKDKGPNMKHLGGRGKKANPEKHLCPWVLLVSWNSKSETWVVRTFVDEHICNQSRDIKACTATFLSKKLVDQLQENPRIPIRAVQEQMQRQFQVGVSTMKAFRAKSLAMSYIHGDFNSQYGRLRDYVDELKNKNPGSTVKIEVEPSTDPTSMERKFKRIYVCLGSLKQGFKEIGRDFLGLDGAFLKGPFPGQVLTAVGVDPNNGIYPLSYAIVDAENKNSWTWFLECIGEDLDMGRNSNFTFISDRQKGIIPAMSEVFPCAEHRYCLRHISENMKQTYRGKIYKDMLWKIATSTSVVHFDKEFDILKNINSEAASWLAKIPPKHWSRAHFSGRAVSDVLLNNMCEVMNAKIMDGRDKPIITLLEYIREYLMRRVVNVQKVIDRSAGLFTPYATKIFESNKKEASKYKISWNGEEHYQACGPHGSQYVVNMSQRTCTCRGWEITGIPCRHAVAAIWTKGQHEKTKIIPESFIHPVYSMESFKVYPINGMDMWQKSQIPTVITPPTYHKPIGRPRKARKRSTIELEDQRARKDAKSNVCGKCKKPGHNSRTCKGQEQN